MFADFLNTDLFPAPLRGISVTLSINDFVADVCATFNYENEEPASLETTFEFPVDEDSAVYSFEALVDGKKIVAEIQKKRKVWEISTLTPLLLFNYIIL